MGPAIAPIGRERPPNRRHRPRRDAAGRQDRWSRGGAAETNMGDTGGHVLKRDRVGGARNDDRRAGKGTASPGFGSIVSRAGKNGCGNDVPVETPKRFPQGLGNLAKNARFPHFHSQSSTRIGKEKRTRTRKATVATRQINWPQDRRVLGHILDRQE